MAVLHQKLIPGSAYEDGIFDEGFLELKILPDRLLKPDFTHSGLKKGEVSEVATKVSGLNLNGIQPQGWLSGQKIGGNLCWRGVIEVVKGAAQVAFFTKKGAGAEDSPVRAGWRAHKREYIMMGFWEIQRKGIS